MKERTSKTIKALKIISWIAPIAIIVFILYMNFLPFGFSETRTIIVGSETDITPGVFYLEQSPALGARQEFEGQTFRAVDGVVNVIYKPDQILRDATVSAELKGEGVYFIEQPDISNVSWDYDFMKLKFNGIFLSNGPGDPAMLKPLHENIKKTAKFIFDKAIKNIAKLKSPRGQAFSLIGLYYYYEAYPNPEIRQKIILLAP